MSQPGNNLKDLVISRKDSLFRGLFTALFLLIGYFAGFLVFLVAIFQFACELIWGQPNQQITQFGKSLSTYFFDLLNFVTYSSEQKPFPFSPWPTSGTGSHRNSDMDKKHNRNY